MSDSMLGRTWEHMFQWLFMKKAVDCPVEWKTYCRMYHICFTGAQEYNKYLELVEARADLIDMYDVGVLKGLYLHFQGSRKQELKREISVITRQINDLMDQAKIRGEEGRYKAHSMKSLYV